MKNKSLLSTKNEIACDFWSTHLNDVETPQLWIEPKKTNGYKNVEILFPEELFAKLSTLCKGDSENLFRLLLASYFMLISKYGNYCPTAIATPTPKSWKTGEHGVSLLFIKALLSHELTIGELLNEIRLQVEDGHAQYDYLFSALEEQLREITGRFEAVTHVGFSLDQYQHSVSDLKQTRLCLHVQTLNTPVLAFSFDQNFFSEEFIQQFSSHYYRVLDQVIVSSKTKIADIQLMSDAEMERILLTAKGPYENWQEPTTLKELFEKRANASPGATALVYNDKKLTYQELNLLANQRASFLKERFQIQPNEIIALLLPKSDTYLIWMLATVKSGAAFLPIDPEYPLQRIKHIVNTSGAKIIVSNTALEDLATEPAIIIVPSDEPINTQNILNPETISRNTDLSYVIFTSGSTGLPKGVMVENTAITNTIYNCIRCYGYSSTDAILQFTSISFDVSIADIFCAWGSGAALILADKEKIHDTAELHRYIKANQVTSVTGNPSMLDLLEMENYAYRVLNVGGEAADYYQLIRHSKKSRVFNSYGPTEASVICCVFEVTGSLQETRYVPIGRPFSNMELLILDENGRLAPSGCSGEICISGTGLARGYVGGSALDSSQFTSHPFEQGRKMYRTGDYGKTLSSGELIFLGRKDTQVKVNGHRVELREIEHTIRQKFPVDNVKVLHYQKGNQKILTTYYTCTTTITDEEFLEGLISDLPSFMIPVFYVRVRKFITDVHGKIDIRALPDPSIHAAENQFVLPSTSEEIQLAEIWKSKLETSQIGINDDFFQMGGNSILATLMLGQVHKELGLKIDFVEFFNEPTIKALAKLMGDAKSKNNYASIPESPKSEYYELSFAQRRLWVLCQFEEDSIAYNMPFSFYFNGNFNQKYLQNAIDQLIGRHESFRTVFVTEGGTPMQLVLKDIQVPLELLDLTAYSEDAQRDELNLIFKRVAHSAFDLSQGPLLRFVVVQLTRDKIILIFNIHHIINDGWSHNIILKELITLYNSFVSGTTAGLSPVRIQYKDYTYWLRDQLNAGVLADHENYWITKFHDKPNGIILPVDFHRPSVQTFNGGRIPFVIPTEEVEMLNRIVSAEGATFFMGLLTALDILLYKYSGQEDIIIGSPVAGRDHPDLDGMIGFLANTIVYRANVSNSKSYIQLLRETTEDALNSYKFQQYPFDLLIEKLNLNRDLSQSPLFNVMIAHNNTAVEKAPDLSGIISGSVQFDEEFSIAKFDLLFFLDHSDNQVYGELEYNSDLFKRSTATRMAENFVMLVRSLVQNPDKPIGSIAYIQPAEIKRLEHFSLPSATKPDFASIQSYVERQAARSPLAIAVQDENSAITYQDLNEISNRIARYLIDVAEVKKGDIVGVCFERSANMIAVILGIAKAGAAYLAVDPSYPFHRVAFMLNDSKVKFVITDGEHQELLSEFDGVKLHFNSAVAPQLDTLSTENLISVNDPDDVVYVIYTSGTTGTPNGAMLTHGLLSNLIHWQLTKSGIENNAVCLQFTSINFCVSFQEIFMTLAAGGQVCIIGEMERKDMDHLREVIEKEKIENLYLPFSYLNFLLNETQQWHNELLHLKHIITAGEQLKLSRGIRQFLDNNKHVKLHNHYGSSEMHVVSSLTLDHKNIDTYSVTPAGVPIDNTRIVILDDKRNIVPIGVFGELYVQGAYAVPGYVNNKPLNEIKLVTIDSYPGTFYKTGDVGRWMEGGLIELSGRKDSQLKIRGFRVELGEIEARILSFPGTKETVVVASKDSRGHDFLLAYVVFEREGKNALKTFLQEHLPYFMIPQIVVLERLPLMLNGKVDRASLPPVRFDSDNIYKAPASRTEQLLASIWESILDRATIGVDDNFFDIGGHSLKATQMISRVFESCNVKLELRSVFMNPTIEGLAKLIDSNKAFERSNQTPINIVKAPVLRHYPLSHGQHRLWVLDQLEPGNPSYNIPSAYELKGHLDKHVFQKAIRHLIERHEILRTVFYMNEGEPFQALLDPDADCFKVIYEDWQEVSDYDKVVLRAREESAFHFDLEHGPLLRIVLLQLDTDHYILFLTIHHIITDGWSMKVLINNVLTSYKALLTDSQITLPTLTHQYKDFAFWQRSQSGLDQDQIDKVFWKEMFRNEIPLLNLPIDKSRPAVRTYFGDSVSIQIPGDLAEKMSTIGKAEGSSGFMVIMALTNIFLHKITGQRDIVVGFPVAGRELLNLENQIGFYVNSLPVRSFIDPAFSFMDFLKETKKVLLDIFDHQNYPFDRLVNELNLSRDLSRSPIFDVLVTHQPSERVFDQVTLPFEVHSLGQELKISKFDLSFYFADAPENLLLTIEYSTDLFDRKSIERFSTQLLQLLENIVEHPDALIEDLSLVSTEEYRNVIQLFNKIDIGFPRNKRIHQVVEDNAIASANACALVYHGKKLSYADLNTKANQLAHCLRSEHHLAPGKLVGVLMERSDLAIISILAILKTGCAYVPIDPSYPVARIKFIIDDADLALIIKSDGETKISLPEDVVAVDVSEQATGRYSGHDIQLTGESSDIAYVIYTSGSTGNPKGVKVSHENLVRLIVNDEFPFSFSGDDRWILFHSLSFDVSVWEIFACLFSGGCLFIADAEILYTPKNLLQFIIANRITILNQVPSVFYTLLDEIRSTNPLPVHELRYILFAGESLNASFLRWLKATYPACRLVNLYGITETTIHVTYKEITESDIESGQNNIGLPMPTQAIYIVDDLHLPVPIGVVGEIAVGGYGVALGYLNNDQLTSVRFVENPFVKGGRLYLSGDLARRLPDGQLIYCGRKDHQVKIRGFRIECGEIESALRDSGATDAIVTTLNSNEDSLLVAYVTGVEEPEIGNIRNRLAQKLPAYMLPATFVCLETFPLSSNGKVDRKELPAPTFFRSSIIAPSSDTELRLENLWKESLGLNEVGIHDNFFELGGHSLKAVSMLARASREFDVKITLRDIFNYPTLGSLARLIDMSSKGEYQEIPNATLMDYYPLSHAQMRLWLTHNKRIGDYSYNVPEKFYFTGTLNVPVLQRSFDLLVDRYEILRTRFVIKEGVPSQIITERQADLFQVIFKDVASSSSIEEAENIAYEHEATRVFDLSNLPLITLTVVKLDGGRHAIILNLHHIITDEWSMQIIKDELTLFYFRLLGDPNFIPAPLRLQYKDYAIWNNHQLSDEKLQKARNFWLKKFSVTTPVLDLPFDRSKTATLSIAGNRVAKQLPAAINAGIRALSTANGNSVFITSVAIVNLLLHKYSGQKDITIGTLSVGRDHVDLENQIGFFVNTLALSNPISLDDTFGSFLQKVSSDVLESFEYQSFPFDMLITELNIKRDNSTHPLFDIMVTYYNQEESGIIADDKSDQQFSRSYMTQNVPATKFDITFGFIDHQDSLEFAIEYRTDLFNEGTINKMIRHFEVLCEAIIERSDVRISDIEMTTLAERSDILKFNPAPQPFKVKTIQELFEETAALKPANVSIIFNEQKFTYQQLNERSNQIAHDLRNRFNIVPGDIVSIMIDRSTDMIAAILGVIKSGGAYLPIEPNSPESNVRYILEDSQSKVLIVSDSLIPFAVSLPILDLKDERLSTYDKNNPEIINKPGDVCYVIYTSGSTGKPKGVMIEHRSLSNLVFHQASAFPLTEQDKVLLKTSYSFDASVDDIFRCFIPAATLVLMNQNEERNALAIADYIQKYKISCIYFVPSHFRIALGVFANSDINLSSLKYVFNGGEPLTTDLIHSLRELAPKSKYINLYGPTEATVDATIHTITTDDLVSSNISIGKPVSNVSVYILDQYKKLCPPGVKGQICISGVGLAKGYTGDQELTSSKFIQNPYTGERMFTTGDVGKWLPDGTILFYGRSDNQVKIRGHRVEPEQVEYAVLQLPGVVHAAILVKKRDDVNELICMVHLKKYDGNLSFLRKALLKELPSYMVPSQFLHLESFPFLPNGKIDRSALNRIVVTDQSEPVSGDLPKKDMERGLLSIWSSVLNKNNIGVNDDFFELGGDSFKVMRVAALVKKELDRDISMDILFRFPTVSRLALELEYNLSDKTLFFPFAKSIQQSKGSFFFIPPIISSVTMYQPLAKKLAEHSYDCYALQYKASTLIPYYMMNLIKHDAGLPSPPFAFDGHTERSVKDMAKTLFNDVISTGITENIILFGFSFGGLVAFELARMLEKQGITSLRIVILDNTVSNNEKVIDQLSLHEFFTAELKKIGVTPDAYAFKTLDFLYTNYLDKISAHIVKGSVDAPMLAIEAVNRNRETKMIQWSKHSSHFDGVEYIGSEHMELLEHGDELMLSLASWLGH